MNTNNKKNNEIDIQRNFYKKIGDQYSKGDPKNAFFASFEHSDHLLPLSLLAGLTNYLEIKSILDLGAGNGKSIRYFKKVCPNIKVVGIEPVKEVREIAYSEGITREELIDGDATKLDFKNSEFDLVCEFGILHHIKNNKLVVDEMLRVSKKAVFISDGNNLGEGSVVKRSIKQILNALRLWKLLDFIKTKGKGYSISEADGLAYSYSVFNNYQQIKSSCKSVHIMNPKNAGVNLYRTADHIVLLGIK